MRQDVIRNFNPHAKFDRLKKSQNVQFNPIKADLVQDFMPYIIVNKLHLRYYMNICFYNFDSRQSKSTMQPLLIR